MICCEVSFSSRILMRLFCLLTGSRAAHEPLGKQICTNMPHWPHALRLLRLASLTKQCGTALWQSIALSTQVRHKISFTHAQIFHIASIFLFHAASVFRLSKNQCTSQARRGCPSGAYTDVMTRLRATLAHLAFYRAFVWSVCGAKLVIIIVTYSHTIFPELLRTVLR